MPVHMAATVAAVPALSQVLVLEVSLQGCGGPVYLLQGCLGLPPTPLVPVGASYCHTNLNHMQDIKPPKAAYEESGQSHGSSFRDPDLFVLLQTLTT